MKKPTINPRRILLQRGLVLGGVSLLAGCRPTDMPQLQSALSTVSRFNDRVQAGLFDPQRLAPTYPDLMIQRPFPFNAYYAEDEAPSVDPVSWRLALSGLIAETAPWTRGALLSLPQTAQVTRHICIEGWSAIGQWSGVPLGDFLRRVGADLQAKYVSFRCADDYFTSIDMASALHPQTLLALMQDGEVLPRRHGFPLKLRIPTKLGYKNPKHIVAMAVGNQYTGGYWEDQGYNWFGGS